MNNSKSCAFTYHTLWFCTHIPCLKDSYGSPTVLKGTLFESQVCSVVIISHYFCLDSWSRCLRSRDVQQVLRVHSVLEAKRSDAPRVMAVFPVLDKFCRLDMFIRAKPFFIPCIILIISWLITRHNVWSCGQSYMHNASYGCIEHQCTRNAPYVTQKIRADHYE